MSGIGMPCANMRSVTLCVAYYEHAWYNVLMHSAYVLGVHIQMMYHDVHSSRLDLVRHYMMCSISRRDVNLVANLVVDT